MSIRTTAVLVEEPGGPFVLGEVELDEPREDEVLVRIVATGLCHTDLTVPTMLPAEMMPIVVGHEGTGVVERVGAAVSGIEVGDHVVLSFRSCRACGPCLAGDVGYCEQSLLLNYMAMRPDGSTTMRRESGPVFGSFFGQSSFARHALAYADNVVVVDKSLDLTRLAPFGCGFQTGAGTVLNLLQPAAEDPLVVFGAGAVGLAAIAMARGLGVSTVVAVDPAPGRRAVAEKYGALALDPAAEGEPDVAERVKALTGGGARYAIDTTALPAVVLQAQHSLRTRGMLVALGLGAPEYTIDAIDLLQTGKIVRSSIEGESDPLVTVPELIEHRSAGRFDVDHLVTTYPFTKIAEAVADSAAGTVVKPVLVWEE
ncbi:NAD(P)-dependent alcohol dehydrogenase [Nocardioides sp. zg-536]|uniref:NAD(P)-dependent alcohol dehydrogenase n=1 Tax=Nocardioides faecalis TaxID=2803858 RepID=A0A938Y797_9ACTN|nr:NAD(P)-dependent alcohol dehydrogenase [Nocardioides faecalis]MBM9461388.1 NAD(P)-dependent alcohol dehydrogenase [Nocardioides faecalis]MBS4752352.1 NAD(P)-dependent alcohol dehydrogenase [Nocardioides faecalis]QVI57650.1 NAD(P)-dependent alcohol dehydrogenase [Nocardioides faecalis]